MKRNDTTESQSIIATFTEVEAYARAKSKLVLCTELRDDFDIEHTDGSKLLLRHVLHERLDEWHVFYTEHLGTFVFHQDDLRTIHLRRSDSEQHAE